jgi:hypothetical protein
MFDPIFENLDAMIAKLKREVAANIKLQPINDSINILQSIKRLQIARGILQRVLVDEGATKHYLKNEIKGADQYIETVLRNGQSH